MYVDHAARYLARRALRGDTPRVDADNPAWMPPEPGAVRALSVPLKLMDQARALKHDKDLSNRLTDRAARACCATVPS